MDNPFYLALVKQLTIKVYLTSLLFVIVSEIRPLTLLHQFLMLSICYDSKELKKILFLNERTGDTSFLMFLWQHNGFEKRFSLQFCKIHDLPEIAAYMLATYSWRARKLAITYRFYRIDKINNIVSSLRGTNVKSFALLIVNELLEIQGWNQV